MTKKKKQPKDMRGRLILKKTVVMKDRRKKRRKSKLKKQLEQEIAEIQKPD
ncbi:MAG: hypothetical protein ACREJQ_04645 [bacterium]